jgi:hypothetical protein
MLLRLTWLNYVILTCDHVLAKIHRQVCEILDSIYIFQRRFKMNELFLCQRFIRNVLKEIPIGVVLLMRSDYLMLALAI